MRFDERDPGELARHEFRRIGGQERTLDSDAFQTRSELSKMINNTLRGIKRRSRGLQRRSPELPKVLLISFHSVPDIGRLVRTAFDIDQERQITADADRVEMIEEEEPVAAEKILNVVLGRDHRRVHAGLVEERVQSGAIKWR